MDTTDITPGTDRIATSRPTAQAGSLTLTVWPDDPLGEHQRYAYRILDAATGQATSSRDLFTGAGAPISPGRAIRELARYLSAAGEAQQYALDHPGVTPENANLFPEGIAEAARANLAALTLLAEHGPEPSQPRDLGSQSLKSGRRWVSVVFLQGAEADEVLDLLDQDGAGAAIEHLAGYDFGEETTQAALESGYVYDSPPTGMLDRTIGCDVYMLVYNPFLGHVSLLREYDALPDPVLLDVDNQAPTSEQPSRASGRAAGRETADWFAGPTLSPQHGRALSL
ncbi:hypothetical protein [Rathayibacter soli]|uniref:hypothetical protein n=1 Tax=Rathayibacter soli TaxID=3144168 RepID=UPI0027E46678|nr:hypothetical protein [Glaciibacter superstes]